MPRRRILAAAVAAACLGAGFARADGGLVRLREQAGPYLVSVLTSPTPLRPGPAEVSVLVQDAASAAALLDARVSLSLTAPDGETWSVATTRSAGSNRLLHHASVELPAPGRLELRVRVVRRGVAADVRSVLPVEAGSPLRTAIWPHLLGITLATALFALHQSLAGRQGLRTREPRRAES